MVWKIVLTRRERLKKSFSLFYFPVSDRQENLSPLLDKKFYCKEKWWKFFYLSCCSFWPDKGKCFYRFRVFISVGQKKFPEQKSWIFPGSLFERKKDFWRVDGGQILKMPITSALAIAGRDVHSSAFYLLLGSGFGVKILYWTTE